MVKGFWNGRANEGHGHLGWNPPFHFGNYKTHMKL